MSEINAISQASKDAVVKIQVAIAQTTRNILAIIGQTAATKYTIESTPIRDARGFRPSEQMTDPRRLTHRTGALARVLVDTRNPQAIHRVKMNGLEASGEFGLGPEATHTYGIHEAGGTIPARTQDITERMRKFFWAKYYEGQDDRWKFMALSKGPLNIPAFDMPARPFLAPSVIDPDVREAAQTMYAKTFSDELAASMRAALGVS